MTRQFFIHLLAALLSAAALAASPPARAQPAAPAKPPVPAGQAPSGPLVDAAWLQGQLGRPDLLVLDASMTHLHAQGHIPGAISADLYRYGPREASAEQMQRRLRSWGVQPDQLIVVYDEGGAQMATRLYFDLHEWGGPARQLVLLDGGLAAWKAAGGTVTRDPSPRREGIWTLPAARPDIRSRLPEFVAASGDTGRQALVDALDPGYYYGETRFFDRGGHMPNARLLPADDFYNPDKTFKSADEIRRLVAYHGLTPDQVVHNYCGGGVAASVPWFAMKVLLGWPQVKLYLGSQMEYLRDERGLPVWTYAAPHLMRERTWVAAWGASMLRMFDAAQLSVVDPRPAAAYALGHVPFALNLPAETLAAQLHDAPALAARLGPAGVNDSHEAVVTGDGGINERSALAFLALHVAGQRRVSILLDSVDEWGLQGQTLVKEPTIVGRPASPKDLAVPQATYAATARPGVVVRDPGPAAGPYPRVHLALGSGPLARPVAGTVVRVATDAVLKADGAPRPAHEIWSALSKAGLPRHAEVIATGDTPGQAAMAYIVLRLMGWPDVKAWVP
ncbi:MAG: rhodanese-like domain-containing protein [Aquabacterium sp.]